MKSALQTKNNDDLKKAFSNLKSHYKYLGILTIASMSIYAIIFIVAIIGGLT